MKGKVILIETYSHHDSFLTIQNLFSSCSYELNVISSLEDAMNFLKTCLYNIPPVVVYINTIEGRQTIFYYRFIKKLFSRCKAVIIAGIHNLDVFFPEMVSKNDWLVIREYYVKNYSEFFSKSFPEPFIWNYIKFLSFLSRKIRKYLKGIIVFGDYIQCPGKMIKNITIECVKIPTRLTDPRIVDQRINQVDKLLEKKPTFVVPGTVLVSLRDYDLLIDTFESVKKEFQLILLGKMRSERIKARIKTSSIKNKIRFFEDFIPENTFQKILDEAHFSIVLTKAIPPFGKYKVTGSFHDSVSRGLPTLIPYNYAPEYDFGEGIIRYRRDPRSFKLLVENLIESIKSGEYMEKYLIPATKFAKRYTLESIKPRFEEFLRKIFQEVEK